DFFLTDSDITALQRAYETNCLTARPMLLPASLSCTGSQPHPCLSCDEIRDVELSFAAAYPFGMKPEDPEYYELLAKYLKKEYNWPSMPINADSMYENELTTWLNTEFNRHLGVEYYRRVANNCSVPFQYPDSNSLKPQGYAVTCLPRFITCCEAFTELDRFRN